MSSPKKLRNYIVNTLETPRKLKAKKKAETREELLQEFEEKREQEEEPSVLQEEETVRGRVWTERKRSIEKEDSTEKAENRGSPATLAQEAVTEKRDMEGHLTPGEDHSPKVEVAVCWPQTKSVDCAAESKADSPSTGGDPAREVPNPTTGGVRLSKVHAQVWGWKGRRWH
ncbi:hypothetical protein NDU88_002664 [Pleurodeles waltl]|uniref:Uncharacterized protein n=1 Tax=Pleurodeles waltl TaxID=8319 RepID=A0AAV7WP79_PLEWA|nr:hypothetical protein NDU88_002664 [Pleurodeles waltl]